MKHFCIVANNEKEKSEKYAVKIQEYLVEKGCGCDIISVDSKTSYKTDINSKVECLIVLGGDGTMLHAAKEAAEMGIPLYGINFGAIGFLTDSDKEDMWMNIDRLLNDDYSIESRMMLYGYIESGNGNVSKKEFTLNDFCISKREFSKLIQFAIYINGELLDTFRADGIILSTPTGSTAYNLSAGGPVISPDVEAIAVTPICPHSINDRSFIIGSNDKIDIKLLAGKHADMDSAIIYADGNTFDQMNSGDVIHIERAEIEAKIILLKKTNFYHKMRVKLITGGKN